MLDSLRSLGTTAVRYSAVTGSIHAGPRLARQPTEDFSMNRILPVVLATFVVAACSDSSPIAPTSEVPSTAKAAVVDGDIIVSNSDDAGPGSLRDAVAQASTNASIQTIGFLPKVSKIHLQSPITFTGAQGLTINGNKATVDGSGAGGTAFTTTKGGDLTLIDITFRDAPGSGVDVDVPNPFTGTVDITLVNVDIIGNGSHGFVVNDQDDPTTPDVEPPVNPVNTGSAASINLVAINTRFIGNGYTVSDRDGLRVNEGGVGDITVTFRGVIAESNAADGIELDERAAGNVNIDVSDTKLIKNGPFDPNDLDDGFDIDEWDDGSITGTVVNSIAHQNYEEGFDFNENNAGNLAVNFTEVTASSNGEEGIDLEEDDDVAGGGNLITVMERIKTFANGDGADGGLKIREKSGGDLNVSISSALSQHNVGSGIFIRESGGGNAVVNIDNVNSNANRAGALDPFSAGHGIEIIENGAGNLTGTVTNVTVSSNAGFGIFASHEAAGTGVVTASRADGNGNALGKFGGIVTEVP